MRCDAHEEAQFNIIMPLVPTPAPRLDLLPEIQVLMLPVILALYCYSDGPYLLQVLMCNKHLFTLLENMGVFDQRRIDAEVSSETHREQYQRLETPPGYPVVCAGPIC